MPSLQPEPEEIPSKQLNQYELLVRVDERTRSMLGEIRALQATAVTKVEFGPVKNLVYGLSALLLTGVVMALLGLALRQSP